MAKRFTESDKWSDPWFRGLPAEHKLAWLYLLDNCDTAGVINLDRPLADFQIGTALDWEDFRSHCADRLLVLPSGKWFVCRFVEFQYGNLSRDCRAHNPVFLSLERNGIDVERLLEGYPTCIQRGQDKDKDKDKDQIKKKGASKNQSDPSDDWVFPDGWESEPLRQALDAFASMRSRIGKPVRSRASTSKAFKNFDSPEHLLYAAEFCESNDYQGLKPDYQPPNAKGLTRGGQMTFAQQRVSNTQRAIEEAMQND